jgi:hypothetical protein
MTDAERLEQLMLRGNQLAATLERAGYHDNAELVRNLVDALDEAARKPSPITTIREIVELPTRPGGFTHRFWVYAPRMTCYAEGAGTSLENAVSKAQVHQERFAKEGWVK